MSKDSKPVPVETPTLTPTFNPPKENDNDNDNDIVTGNEYLKKEQQKFFANQWISQQNFQIKCGGADKIRIEEKDYSFRGVTKAEENEVRLRAFFYDKLNIAFNYDIGVLNLKWDSEEKDITKFKEQIQVLKKALDQADADFITYGAKIYFDIPEDITLKHFEEVSPYVIGRKYLNDIRVSGNRNDLPRLIRDLTERKYY